MKTVYTMEEERMPGYTNGTTERLAEHFRAEYERWGNLRRRAARQGDAGGVAYCTGWTNRLAVVVVKLRHRLEG
jgi:hypothetical protein